MSSRRSLVALAVPLLLLAACGSTAVGPTAEAGNSAGPVLTARTSPLPEGSLGPSATTPGAPTASGAIDPAGFTSAVTNPWFPLTPGTTFTYQGTKDDKKAVETFTVTRNTKIIDGVTCVVVDDKLSLGGVTTENLIGYYAQDRAGTVWYFGEDMQELDANGQVVSTDGSWHAGLDNAPPAVFMEASPTVGRTFAHDYTKNDFAVVSLSEKVTVPYGAYTDALVTKEWSPLEPAVVTHKFYVRGLGAVRDVAVKGPAEELVLVKVQHP
jgi:hypothetical protein